MEKYTRKILSNRVITSIDTDGDGQDDAITLMSLTPVNIQFFLKENVDNMGLFTDFVEEVEIIDIDNIWDFTNDGSGDGGSSSDLPDLTNPYNDGTISSSGGVLPAYCTDPEAENYFNGLSQPEIDALGNPFDPISNPSGTWVDAGPGGCDFGTGINVDTGIGGSPDAILWVGPTTGKEYSIRSYRTTTAQSCWNQWGGHAYLPADCGGNTNVQGQCGYPQALNFARQFCNESTEDGAAIGEWSLLEYTLESNASYNPTGQVQADMTDTAPFPINNTPFPTTTSTVFGGPAYIHTNENTGPICWNDMTSTFQNYMRNKILNTTPPISSNYQITIQGQSYGSITELEVGSCNNCDNTGPSYQYGRCKHDTSAKQTIVNGLSFRWLNYDVGNNINGSGECGGTSLDCYPNGNPTYFNNLGNPGVWDYGNLFTLDNDTPNYCGHELRQITLEGAVTLPDVKVLLPRIMAKTYKHLYSFNCKRETP